MSSFHEDLVLQLRADLARAFNLPAGAVYEGDRPQKVTRIGMEVWIKPSETEPAESNLKVHPYEVHVRLKGRRAGDQAGALLSQAMKEHLQAVRQRYDGRRPFVAAIATLVACKAEERQIQEPEDDGTIDGHVLVSFVEL